MSHSGTALDAFDLLPAGVLVLQEDGRIKAVNTEAAHILEQAAEFLILQPIDVVFAPIQDVVAVAQNHSRGESLLHTPSGERLVGYTASCGDIDAPLIVLFQDISRVRQLREERDRLLRMATVSKILPTVLHELRNPLAAVTSAVELLLEDVVTGIETDNTLQPTLHSVLNELRRMSLVFHGIGIVGRRLRSTIHAAIDIAVSEAVRMMNGRANADGISLVFKHHALPLLPFDPSVIRSIVFNLINNALQASKSGDHVNISIHLDQDTFVLQVADTGKGMSPEILKRCTHAFFSTRHNGSGLGLVICREAVEEAGGSFTIQSQLGKGTMVNIVIPIKWSRRATDAYVRTV